LGRRWLAIFQDPHKLALSTDEASDQDEPEWVIEQAKARKRREMLRQREEMEARLAKIRAKEKAEQDKYLKGGQAFKKRKGESNEYGQDGEEQFILDDYESDQEKGSRSGGSTSVFSAATLELMSKVGIGPTALKDEEEEIEDEIKVGF
jgi:chromosome transmission fidelity protein 1